MKKTISLIISFVLIIAFLVGCSDQTMTTSLNIGENIDKRLDRLSLSVTKLDTIDNQYITNPDIFPNYVTASVTVPNPSEVRRDIIASNIGDDDTVIKNALASTNSTNDTITDLLLQKLQNNLKCDENGNCYVCGDNYGDCDNNTCNSCNNNIICDNNGNCYKCSNYLTLDQNGNCTNCQNPCVNGDCSNINYNGFNTASDCLKNYRNQLETNNLNASPISVTTEENKTLEDETIINSEIKDTTTITEEDLSEIDNNINKNKEESNNNVYVDTNINNESDLDNTKVYYYYEEQNFTPENLKYNPRYISNYNQLNTSTDLNNYVIKIQKLYAMTADVVEANNTLHEFKDNLLNTISTTKHINNQYKNINIVPPTHQIQAIKNYLKDLETTTKRIKDANGDLNNEINNINNSSSLGVSSSVDVINSNYIRILNHLDTRITYHESALSTLEQLRYLLIDAIDEAEDNTTVDTPIINEDQNLDNNDNDIIEDDNNENTDLSENENDINETEDNESENELDNNSNFDNNDDNKVIDNNTEEDIINNDLIVDNEDNTNIEDNLDNEEDNIDNDTSTNTDVIIEDDGLKNDMVIDNNIDDNNTNETNNFITPNIDTYKPNTNDTIVDNNTTNTDVVNNTNTNDNIIENQTNNNIAYDDNLNNNSYNINNNTNNNLKNGTNHNRIINENNLNTDNNDTNGNAYVYDEDGKLYNANNNRYTNDKNTNVNTYEYNTLVDTLNQGTIDNGINNL